MTDRHAGYVVVLKRDIREDDAAGIIAAISHVKGVINVVPVVGDPGVTIAENRAKREMWHALWKAHDKMLLAKDRRK